MFWAGFVACYVVVSLMFLASMIFFLQKQKVKFVWYVVLVALIWPYIVYQVWKKDWGA